MAQEIEVIQGQIPGLARLVEFLRLFVQNDFSLRQIQAQNAPRPVYGQQVAVAAATVFRLPQAIAENTAFSYLVVVLDTASGSGRYRIDGIDPTTNSGFEVPSGGTVITVEGAEAIKNFALFADVGNTLAGFAQPFQ